MIDHNYAPPGFVAVEETLLCDGCVFVNCDADVCSAISKNMASCASGERPDGRCVIFVVRPTSVLATDNVPHDSEGTPV